ncbi:putative miz zinc finger protein [Phaeomoniella chlamydospora]|uniref:Putative miz zinc finger protein n=1 Tax=Phaeomoniella chlamydospora TaxID=158046 RepID=A0A0G2EFP6_PHACM|nr:putative miz zinc finger protein [Phaeomoniella chlamydospora]
MATNGRRPVPVERLNLKIKTLLNAHLKDILRQEGLPVSGIKQELVNRLQARGFIQNIENPSNSREKPGIAEFAFELYLRSFQLGSFKHISIICAKVKFIILIWVIPKYATAARTSTGGLSPYTSSDIAFPHQCELSCNLDEVKANLRGLKNKPGSTRPADITSYLRKKPGYSNKLSITYALTTKKYYIVINLVKKHSVEDLVQKIKAGKYISKESVLKEMRGKAEDADIVAMSSVMSLKCPLSTLRLDVPTRSMHCTHNQCFDAASFLQLQEQAPTWTCPICNKSTPYDSLTMDMYVDDILKSTGRNVEQVTVEPDGRWTKNAGPETPDNSRPSASEEEEDDDDDDDDIVEIQDVRVSSIKQESTPTTSTPTHQTPPYSSREHSVASSAARHPSSAAKRPASAVIDLTESDDEDAIRPPAKRPLPSGLGGLSRFGESPVSFQLPRVGGLAGSQQQQGQSHSNNSGSGSGSSYRPSPSANGQYFNTSL